MFLVPYLLFLAVPLLCEAKILSVTLDDSLSNNVISKRPKLIIHDGEVEGNLAVAKYDDQTMKNGWAYLEVTAKPLGNDFVSSYAAGVLEGASSHEIIYNSWLNTMKGFCDWKGEKFCVKLRKFLSDNDVWMKHMMRSHSASDPLWYQVSLIREQLKGLVDGYNQVAKNPISFEDFLWMNLSGDLEDLDSVISKTALEQVRGDGHCSALIKLLPGNTDLYTSHVTWNSFQSMLRIQKKFSLPFKTSMLAPPDSKMPGHTVSFSSYPGILHSADDYYLLSSGLLTMETTIGNSNPDLWSNVTPDGEIQEWIRTMVANRLAVDGRSWTKIFKQYNSGTYNNQWMVVDYKLFTPMKVIRPNTLWVLEQLPGLVVAADQSQRLRKRSFWPSYNVPFYSEIFNTSGLPALVDKFGDWFSYDKTARALIFARDHSNVKDLGSMIKLMRYNDFKHDPLSKCDCSPPFSGENAISARNDLNPKNGTYPFGALGHRSHAGTDMKVTSSRLFKNMEYLAVNGPTNDNLPVFQWSKSDFNSDTAHFGHPDVWDFPVVHQTWKWNDQGELDNF